ncbi:MAG: hypothetical protein IKX06_03980 [Clostridia bacterium]|nr:hypothetical protein [Clostridia bacterium]
MGFFDNIKKKIDDVKASIPTGNEKREIVFDDIPETLDAFKALPQANLKDPFEVAALAIVALNIYPVDKDTSIAMIDYLKGPDPLSGLDKSFIKDRFMDGKEYVVRSYFKGASPENDYAPASPYTIVVESNPYSKIDDTNLQLWVTSFGADSPRPIGLRQKPSTGEWFLREFKGVLAGVREPVSQNPWA